MQFIFFVLPNEELAGTLYPQKFGCTLKNEGKRVHVPPDEKPVGMLTCPTDLRNHCFEDTIMTCIGVVMTGTVFAFIFVHLLA